MGRYWKIIFLLLCIISFIGLISGENSPEETNAECDCGEDECVLDTLGKKKCNCKEKYLEFNGKCIECDCGEGECELDTLGKKKCNCKEKHLEFNGKCIEVPEKHPCHANEDPCGDHGFCEEVGENYKCKCSTGYSGIHCDSIEWCENNKISLCGEKDCKFDKFTKSGYCDCGNNQTVYFDVKTKECNSINACSMKKAKGECNKLHEKCNEGKCECEKNYVYNGEKECISDFCGKSTGNNPCGPYSKCVEISDGTYKCLCDTGYTWDGRQCKSVNPCSVGFSKCEQKCTDGICSCHPGYSLKEDNTTCKLDSGKKECSKDCGPGKCIDDKCVCPEISHISMNDTCVDLCTAGKDITKTCPRNIGCIQDKKYGFICNCTGIYKLSKDGVHCDKKNMCVEGNGATECEKENAVCQTDLFSDNGFKCVCRDGYQKENNICTHKCLLKAKVKECVDMLGVCELNSAHDAVCKCRPLMQIGTSDKCDQLSKNSFTGNFLVQRRTYEIPTSVSRRSKRSTKSIDYNRIKKDFSESLSRVYVDYLTSNILNCQDQGTYLNCTVELQLNKEYTTESLRIITTRTVCLPIDGNKDHCLLQPYLVVKKSSEQVFTVTDPCIEEVRSKVCGSATNCTLGEERNFKCACSHGFKSIGSYYPDADRKMLIENCEDVNECSNTSACPSTTDCVNIYGSYLCPCKNGYRKNSSDTDTKKNGCIAVCNPNPCEHGTCHQTGDHGFSCNCEKFYTGFLCNELNKGDGNKAASIVGGVLGAALALTLIIGFVLYRRMQKKTEDDNDEYARRRKQGILSNMGRFGRKEQSHDIEVHALERQGSGDYRREYRESELAIPRPHVGGGRQEKRESGDYRRGYAGDDRMFPKSSRPKSDEDDRQRQTRDPQSSRRPLSRSSDHLNGEERKTSVVQYRNRGFEED